MKQRMLDISNRVPPITVDIVLLLFALILAITGFPACGDTLIENKNCSAGYILQNGECTLIDSGELDCGVIRTFQVNFVDAVTKAPVAMPISAEFQNISTLEISNGRNRINDPDGVYIFDGIELCAEYMVSATAPCYVSLDRANFEIPRSTIWTIELEPTANCSDNDLLVAFEDCRSQSSMSICCSAFPQNQFDLYCNRAI